MEKEKAVKNPLLAREMEVLAFWEKAAIFKKSVEKDAPQGDYVFYEGPPTANGTPGIHHVLARAFKDVLPRYKTMQGFRVERKAGWDTHGLPVELQVEKELGISGKPDIEKYGIEAFNKKCRESVWRYLDEWEKLTRRIAFWVDMEHPYVTYENYYIESLWRIIKEFHNRGLLYKGHKVVPHCPRCGTALSSHEVAQGYRQVKDNSVYLKFKVTSPLPLLLISLPAGKAGRGEGAKRQGEVFILAWTTTPWTLPGNVALAVGENIEYVAIKHEDQNQEVYILAKDRLSIIDFDYEIVKEFKGKELVGLEYEPLFEIKSVKESGKKAYYVAPADFVTTEDGTGVVHTAVMYGEDDYLLGEKIGLPKIHTVDESGFFKADLAPCGLSGKYVKDPVTEKIILDHLRSQNLLFKEEMYEHDYPFCWRCDSPLLYYAKDSWFVQMTAARADLVANNEKINWVPEHIKTGRFGEWLANVKDWAISRERYWGTPLPVWKCAKCGAIKCVGSRSEIDRQMGAFYIFRHGEAENNVKRIYSTDKNDVCGLTESGRKTVNKSAEELKHKDFELIISSDIRRAKET
ncbi:MAG: class I tRNA ligase family protein, partial [Planctomycetes bacterium]|nr:class I tRNA ligase family protein [Planctomycetota bacterium]